MSSPFNAEFKPYNDARTTVGPNTWGQTMSLDMLRKHSKVFEKKLLKASSKKNRTPFKAKEQDVTSEESSQNFIDAQFAKFCPIKSYPILSKPGGLLPDLFEPGDYGGGINLSTSWTICPDTSSISSLKNIVIIFGFLSKLEAHIENSGNVIIVRWVARTKKSYLFMKDKLCRFGKRIEQRLNRKIVTDARYRK